MADCSIVSLAQLENFQDFSPDYYLPQFLDLAKQLRKWPTARLSRLAYVTDGEHGSPQWDPNSGIRYVSADFIKPNYINDAPMRTISKAQATRNQRCTLRLNDVLVYSVGAYAGYSAKAEPHLFPASIPRSVAIIRPLAQSGINSGFLTVFLNSRFGVFQSKRFRAGNSQPVLALDKIRQFEVPLVPEKLQMPIGELYDQAYRLRMLGQKAYNEGRTLLDSNLGLDKLTFAKPMGYVARFSDLKLSRRADAQHYQPQFDALFKHLVSFRTARLRSIKKLNRRGVQPIYINGGPVPIVNSQHLGPRHISYDSLERTSKAIFYAAPVAHILRDDLLIYTTGAYIGRTNVYLSDEPALASNHVNILRLQPEVDAAYMSLVMQSVVGQFQTQKHARGSAQAELYPSDIDKFVVPLLPTATQKSIGDLLRESLRKELESKSLLEEAKARVEQLIEEAVKS